MSNLEQLVDRHIKEYEARLKHVDEMMEQAEAAAGLHEELHEIKQEREAVAEEMQKLRSTAAEDWSEKGGPMVMWDIVAQRLENLVEKVERWKPH